MEEIAVGGDGDFGGVGDVPDFAVGVLRVGEVDDLLSRTQQAAKSRQKAQHQIFPVLHKHNSNKFILTQILLMRCYIESIEIFLDEKLPECKHLIDSTEYDDKAFNKSE